VVEVIEMIEMPEETRSTLPEAIDATSAV